jgi:SPOR domain
VLKFVFWILVGLNAVLFAFSQGYLGKFKGEEREPARLKNQLESGKLKMVTAEQAQPAGAPDVDAAPAAVATAAPAAPVPAATAPAPAACTEVGPLSTSDDRRFEARVAKLGLGQRQAKVTVPYQEVTSRLVYIPSQGSKEAADRKAQELRGLGVANFFVISGDSPYKYGISLGLFKSEASAQAMLAMLNKQGVRSARIAPRGPVSERTVYQFRGLDADTREKIVKIADRYDTAQVRVCK